MNFAIARKTDEHFVAGKRYECTNTYDNFIDVLSEDQKLIKIDLSDADFLFVLNIAENGEEKSVYEELKRNTSIEEAAKLLSCITQGCGECSPDSKEQCISCLTELLAETASSITES